MASKDKDYRLITLLTDVCPLVLKKYFVHLASSDGNPGVPYSTLDQYMAFRQQDVNKLMTLPYKLLRKYQYSLIYPNALDEEWDVSLLSTLLLGLFRGQMKNGEDTLITTIRDIRNKLQHKPGNLVISDGDFDSNWNDIKTAAQTLALIVSGSTYQDEIQTEITAVMENNLPRLGDTLKAWYEDIIIQLKNDIEELKESSQKSLEILEASHIKRKLPTGQTGKRCKIIDVRGERLKANFRQTIERELPTDFETHSSEVIEISRKLQNKHCIVVTGSENTNYLQVALSAIRMSRNYDIERCSEIKTPDDWNSVDPLQTDLVLYCEPFKEGYTDKRFCRTFQSLLDTSKETGTESRIDVMIVSEQAKFNDWKEHDSMDLFKNVFELFRPTDETNPLNLEKAQKADTKISADDVLGNMLSQTGVLIDYYRSDQLNQTLMEKVKQKFSKHKSVVITESTNGQSTRFALNMVSSLYSRNQCVLLTDPNDWKQVCLGRVSVVIIDEFAGRYTYNSFSVDAWFGKFDMIYAAVVAGKLNVIVTCKSSFFTKVLKKFTGHALLNHRVKVPSSKIVSIKVEPGSSADEIPSSPSDRDDSFSKSTDTTRTIYTREVEERTPQCGDFVEIKKQDGHYLEFCEIRDGSIICTYAKYGENIHAESGVNDGDDVRRKHKWFLAIFDPKTFETTGCMELAFEPFDLSAVQGNDEVIFRDNSNRETLRSATLVNSTLQLGKPSKGTNLNTCIKLAKIYRVGYIACYSTFISISNLEWNILEHIDKHNDKPLFYEKYENSTSKSSIRKNITDLTLGNDKFFVSSKEKILIINFHGVIQNSLPVESLNTYIYDEKILITTTLRAIYFYHINTRNLYNAYSSETMTRMIYGKETKRLFIANYNTWSTCVVTNNNNRH